MNPYLLPCSCGHALIVGTADAGKSLPCPQCDNEVEVPSLRELRRLPAAQQPARQAARGTWTDLQRVVFGSGMAILFLALAALALASGFRWTVDTSYTEDTEVANGSAVIEAFNVDESYEFWKSFTTNADAPFTPSEIGARGVPPYVINQNVANRLNVAIGIAGGFTLLGLALMVLANFAGGSRA